MARLLFALTTILSFTCNAWAQLVVFDFDNAPRGTSLPVNVSSGGISALLSSSSDAYNYSVQAANVLGFTPVGFAGNCIYPNTINKSDLLVSFDTQLTSISIMYAPEEYATDSSCTMRITAYLGLTEIGSNTTTIDPPGTWPTGTLSYSSSQPFDNVVIHYDQPPVTGGDYGPIFMADNLVATPVPEPQNAAALMLGIAAAAGLAIRRSNGPKLGRT